MSEQYAYNQDLRIWHHSTLLPTPSYDPKTKRWTVTILRDGVKVTLHSYHLVLIIGTLGGPYVPPLPGREAFKGDSFHVTDFKSPQPFAGKKTIVVGACQSTADTCYDLATHGAASIVMAQRSSTIVVSMEYLASIMNSK